MSRVYLDWNATAPLRPEARDAMIAAMDVVGNPSSVHGEGRKAKAIVETARGQVALLLRSSADNVLFTAGATESAKLAIFESGFYSCLVGPFEHDAVDLGSWKYNDSYAMPDCLVDAVLETEEDWEELSRSLLTTKNIHPPTKIDLSYFADRLVCLQHSNSETGVLDILGARFSGAKSKANFAVLRDITQSVGRIKGAFEIAGVNKPHFNIGSSHKIGGPKGVGFLELSNNAELEMLVKGGGQEQGRRSGTENVVGIAGFGAAAEAAQRDLDAGVWDRVEELRDQFEARILDSAPDAIIIGQDAKRLPNTSCIAVPGWKGETQVMQMDLAGYAISAGSACSSGKVKSSRVLKAMGFDDMTASSAIRVSIGPSTTETELLSFADTWLAQYKKFKARAA